jgi:hypothetical protein
MFAFSRAMLSGLRWHAKVKNMKLTSTRKRNDKKREERMHVVEDFLRLYAKKSRRNQPISTEFWEMLEVKRVVTA